MWNLEKPAVLKLARLGAIRGSVACAKDAKAVAKLKLQAMGVDSRRDVDAQVSYSARGATQEDGSFRFDSVPAGRYHVWPELPADSPYYSEGPGSIEVKPAATTTLSLALKPAAAVRGKASTRRPA